eukprot:4443424-Pleurochrysis_carterae.AAC.3
MGKVNPERAQASERHAHVQQSHAALRVKKSNRDRQILASKEKCIPHAERGRVTESKHRR